MNILEELQNQLEDAKADYEAKLANAPDIRTAQSDIELFRAEHADLKRQREAALSVFLVEHADLKRQREAEFAAIQRTARELADAKAEVIRATRALARQDVTAAAAARREEKIQAQAREEAKMARDHAAFDAFEKKCKREQPNAIAEREARKARDEKYSAAEHAAEDARIATNDEVL